MHVGFRGRIPLSLFFFSVLALSNLSQLPIIDVSSRPVFAGFVIKLLEVLRDYFPILERPVR
jgi:hypothetical protein